MRETAVGDGFAGRENPAVGIVSCVDSSQLAIVDLVNSVSEPVAGIVTVTMRDGSAWRLSANSPVDEFRAERLKECAQPPRRPAYLLVERASGMILWVHLYPPWEMRVLEVFEMPEGATVGFDSSAAAYRAFRSRPCFDALLAVLRRAIETRQVILLAAPDSDHVVQGFHGNEIIDVRPPIPAD